MCPVINPIIAMAMTLKTGSWISEFLKTNIVANDETYGTYLSNFLRKTWAIPEGRVWVQDRAENVLKLKVNSELHSLCLVLVDIFFINFFYCVALESNCCNCYYSFLEISVRMTEIQLRRMDEIESWRQKVAFFAIYFKYLIKISGFRTVSNRSNWSPDLENLRPYSDCC